MNYLRIFILLAGLCLLPIEAISAETSLQEQINETPSGGQLIVQSGTYEGPIQLSKPIDLVAKDGVVLVYNGTEEAVSISGQNVSISNLSVKASDQAAAAIQLTGRGHKLIGLDIDTGTIGIRMNKASHVLVERSDIRGQAEKHAIDLNESDDNQFKANTITYVEDGFYVEDSNRNTFTNNEVSEAHYGFHIMYSQGIELTDNTVEESFTGAMVMGASGGTIEGNIFKDNNENVNAQGLLLYDSIGVNVIGNDLVNNRIGLFVEQANANEVRDNLFLSNYIAIQFLEAEDNTIVSNDFRLNLNEAQAIKSSRNSMKRNYWDSAVKVDVNDDGYSDLAYVADPYFLSLTDKVPEFQLFFQSPGMAILQKMLKTTSGELLMDTNPLMKPPAIEAEGNEGSAWQVGVLATVMFGLSASLFLLGRKRS
ncbi:right-handed parallel beta-helix repeat-containing protein [Pradoshia sp.]